MHILHVHPEVAEHVEGVFVLLTVIQPAEQLALLICGQKRWLGLILPLGMQSSHESGSTFCCYTSVPVPDVICWEQPGSLGQVAIELLEGPGAG